MSETGRILWPVCVCVHADLLWEPSVNVTRLSDIPAGLAVSGDF